MNGCVKEDIKIIVNHPQVLALPHQDQASPKLLELLDLHPVLVVDLLQVGHPVIQDLQVDHPAHHQAVRPVNQKPQVQSLRIITYQCVRTR